MRIKNFNKREQYLAAAAIAFLSAAFCYKFIVDPIAKTWSGDSWKHGGSPLWNGGAYDPETNLTFWGTGNPNPYFNGDMRAGDDLYSDSVIALDYIGTLDVNNPPPEPEPAKEKKSAKKKSN